MNKLYGSPVDDMLWLDKSLSEDEMIETVNKGLDHIDAEWHMDSGLRSKMKTVRYAMERFRPGKERKDAIVMAVLMLKHELVSEESR